MSIKIVKIHFQKKIDFTGILPMDCQLYCQLLSAHLAFLEEICGKRFRPRGLKTYFRNFLNI